MTELEDPPVESEIAETPFPVSAPGEKFITFELGDRLFCVPASTVHEVVHSLATAAVPLAPSWLLGLGAFKGEPVALIDSSTVAGQFRPLHNAKTKTIVFHSLANHTKFALPIDSLREIITVDASLLRSGEYVHEGRHLTLVEHDRLINSFQENPF